MIDKQEQIAQQKEKHETQKKTCHTHECAYRHIHAHTKSTRLHTHTHTYIYIYTRKRTKHHSPTHPHPHTTNQEDGVGGYHTLHQHAAFLAQAFMVCVQLRRVFPEHAEETAQRTKRMMHDEVKPSGPNERFLDGKHLLCAAHLDLEICAQGV
jgi:hypothetical protein